MLPDTSPPPGSTERLRDRGRLLVDDLALFDVYRGTGIDEGDRSLAYRLRLQAPDHTLTDAEVASVRRVCIEAAASIGARLRG